MSTLSNRFLERGRPDHAAIVEDGPAGQPRTTRYSALRARAAGIAEVLRSGRPPLAGARVAFLLEPGSRYVEAMLGVFLAGGSAVPLSPLHTAAELAHLLGTAAPVHLLASPALAPRLAPLAGATPVTVLSDDGASATAASNRAADVADDAPAMMLFTSGTTGKPKGVTMSHGALAATVAALEQAWGWRRDDRLLHVLPLHHTHGVVVALLGALWAGATVRFAAFDGPRLWDLFAEMTVFMAVPTIYAKLLAAFRAAPPEQQARWRGHTRVMRLLTSGSAALPADLFRGFAEASGQTLLERYGMTEIGMALSNSLDGPRIAGAVGRALPGVSVDIVGDDGRLLGTDEPGELRVRSPQMFSEYHGDPDATGVIRLLGRTSTDILKSGGYKLSALEIEAVLREHPAIAEVAVIGVPDPTWGDRVTACAVLHPGATLTDEELRAFARDRLAPYKLPRELRIMDSLPRTALGKVQKGALLKA